MENEGPSYYVEASSPFTFWENYSWAPKPLITLVSIPVIILELTHIWKSKKNPRNMLRWIRCLWPESQSGMQRKKQSFGDKVKGIMPKNCAMNKTNQKHTKEEKKKNHTHQGSCLPQGTPQLRTAHDSPAISQHPCNLQSQDIQACWDLLEEISRLSGEYKSWLNALTLNCPQSSSWYYNRALSR